MKSIKELPYKWKQEYVGNLKARWITVDKYDTRHPYGKKVCYIYYTKSGTPYVRIDRTTYAMEVE